MWHVRLKADSQWLAGWFGTKWLDGTAERHLLAPRWMVMQHSRDGEESSRGVEKCWVNQLAWVQSTAPTDAWHSKRVR